MNFIRGQNNTLHFQNMISGPLSYRGFWILETVPWADYRGGRIKIDWLTEFLFGPDNEEAIGRDSTVPRKYHIFVLMHLMTTTFKCNNIIQISNFKSGSIKSSSFLFLF